MEILSRSCMPFVMLLMLALLVGCGGTETSESPQPTEKKAAMTTNDDPYLWLEEVEGERALAWVEERNKASLGYLESLPTFDPLYERNLEIYDSDDRIKPP